MYGGGSAPTASVLNFVAGQTVPDLAFVPVADDGTISVRNGSSGTVDVLADVTGYVRDTDLPVPGASVSRYVTDLRATQSASQIAAVMKAYGTSDAAAATGTSAHLSVLEFGAQTARAGGDGLGGGTSTGVSLVRQGPQGMRLTYAQVQAAARAYLDGYAAGRPAAGTGKVTVALGTNTDGFAGATYTPTAKGQDWAQQVRSAAAYSVTKSYGVTVVGADDIEADFDATAAQVRSWIAGYRGGTSPPALIGNGAASGCPTTLGVTGASCGPVRVGNSDPATYNTWSQADYVCSSTGPGVTVAPQVYVAAQATQWENIALTANAAIAFDGVLTEVAACAQVGGCTSLTPGQAWTAMNQALDAYPATASITVPAVSDIRYPS